MEQPIIEVPFTIEKQFYQELEKRIRDDINEKIEKPSLWLNSYVSETKSSGFAPNIPNPWTIKQGTYEQLVFSGDNLEICNT